MQRQEKPGDVSCSWGGRGVVGLWGEPSGAVSMPLVGDELAVRCANALLTPGVAVDAAIDGPFGKHRGTGLELARLPVGGELVLVRSEEHTSELQSPCNLV